MPEAIARLDALFTFPKLAEGMELSPDHRTELLRVVGVAIDFLKANIGPGAYERFSYLLEILDDLILTYDLKIDIEWTNQISDMKVESVRSHLSSLLHHVAGRPGFYWKRTDLVNALTALKASGASVETYMAYERFVQERTEPFL